MAKHKELLEAFKNNIDKWVCVYCNSNSSQPAATFREIKKMGYEFEEHSPNRWGKEMFCEKCSANRTHYKLLKPNPVFSEKPRINIRPEDRRKIIALLNGRDAFTGGTISSTPEIDHKIPWSRLEDDIDTSILNNLQIQEHFQLLTREHNLLKDRACSSCIKTDKRPGFLGIDFWYSGDGTYKGSCKGCGWYDGVKWREEIKNKLEK